MTRTYSFIVGPETDTLPTAATIESSLLGSKSSSYQILDDDDLGTILGTVGGITITLPTASGNPNRRIIITNVASSGTVTIDGEGAETIDGVASIALEGQYDSTTVVCDGTSWTSINNKLKTSYEQMSNVKNYSIEAVTGASAMTVTLTGADGNALSSSNACLATFRNSTIATGTPVTRRIISDLTLVIDGGATLATRNGEASVVFIYLIDNAGTPELAVSRLVENEGHLVTTVALSGGADSAGPMYSETQRTSVSKVGIGFFNSTQAAAGTWVTNPTTIYSGDISHMEAQITPIITALDFTTVKAVVIPYVLSTGEWRLKGNVYGTMSTGHATTVYTVTGVVFHSGFTYQAATGWNFGGQNTGYAHGNSGTATITHLISSSTSSDRYLSFDLLLNAKPALT